MDTQKRNKEWDLIKGFVLLLVIVGHTTAAFGSFEKDFYLNYIASLRVSFIMPLFLITTGYFMFPPVARFSSFQEVFAFLKKKARRLLVPALVWGLINGALFCAVSLIRSGKDVSFRSLAVTMFYSSLMIWYLFASFFCAFLTAAVIWLCGHVRLRKSTNKNNIYILLCIGEAALLLLPTDRWYLSFAFPFFLVGFLLRQRQFTLEKLDKYRMLTLLGCALFLILVIWFPYDYSVYVAGSNLIRNAPPLRQLFINAYRFVVGVLGSLFVSYALHLVYRLSEKQRFRVLRRPLSVIAGVGALSLEMYVTQTVIVEFLFAGVLRNSGLAPVFTAHPYVFWFLIRPAVSAVLTILVYAVVRVLKPKFGRILY